MAASPGDEPTDRVRVRRAPGEVFVGREEELARLLGLLHRDQAPACGVGLVRGDAGIGKSRLVAEALRRAPARTVLHGRADPVDHVRPFAPILEALAPLEPDVRPADAALARVLDDPDAGSAVGPGLRWRLVDASVEAVLGRAAVGSTALVLEDLHWADPATVAVVQELADPSPDRDLIVLVTTRRAPRSPALRALDAIVTRTAAAVVDLGPLSGRDVRELAATILGRPPSPALEAELARAGGNPFYAGELTAALAEQGSLRAPARAGAPVEVAHASPPPNLRVTVLRRLSELTDGTLGTLRIASLLGSTFDVTELAVGCDLPVPTLVTHLEEAERAGWLRPIGDRYAFRHDLVRDVIHDDQAEPVRRALHRHLADRLAAAEAPPATVARHLVRGATPPDPSAAAWLHAAGRRAASREPSVAVTLLEAAVRLEPAPGRARDAVLLDLGTARCWAGDVRGGERVLRELLARPHAADVDGRATLGLARSLLLAGDSTAALDVLAEGRTRVEHPQHDAALLAEVAVASMLRGELAAAWSATADVLRTPAADDESRCLAHAVACALSALEGRFAAAITEGRRAVEVARTSAARETVRRPPQLFLGSVLLDADAFDEGWRTLDEGRCTSEDLGAVWDLPLVHLVTARGRYLTGEHDRCLAEAETALGLADEVGTHVLEVWGHALAAHVHLHRLDLGAARDALAAGEAVVGRVGLEVRGVDWLVWARARLAEVEDDTDTASALTEAVWDGHASRGLVSERRLFGPALVRLHLVAGRPVAAAEVTAAVVELAGRAGTASAAAAAAHCQGLITADATLLVEAAEGSASCGCLTEHVDQCLAAAAQLAADGALDEAVRWYERGGEAARQVGSVLGRRRAESALRRLGVRPGARGRRRRDRTGWDALTPTERTVAELAAGGLSNPAIGERLFVSRRTVQTHLSHVYAKLGVASRVELAGVVVRRGQGGAAVSGPG